MSLITICRVENLNNLIKKLITKINFLLVEIICEYVCVCETIRNRRIFLFYLRFTLYTFNTLTVFLYN